MVVSQSPVGFDVHWNQNEKGDKLTKCIESLNRLSALMFIGTS